MEAFDVYLGWFGRFKTEDLDCWATESCVKD